MNVRRVVSSLRARRLVLVVTVLVASVSAYRATPSARVYSATSTLFVGGADLAPALSTGRLSATAVQTAAWQNATFAALLDRLPTARLVVARAEVPRSAAQVAAETVAVPVIGTTLLRVTVSDPDPRVAQRLANTMADGLNAEIASLAVPSASGVASTAELFEPATLPSRPLSPGRPGRVLAAATFALLASVAVVLLVEGVVVSARDPAQVAATLRLPVLGTTERV